MQACLWLIEEGDYKVMNSFLKENKSLITFSLILLIIIPTFGINFLISFFGNILILLFLIPLLLIIIAFLGFNSLKSSINTCARCGAITIGSENNCINCGFNLQDIDIKEDESVNNPSERTIEVKAEEIE